MSVADFHVVAPLGPYQGLHVLCKAAVALKKLQ